MILSLLVAASLAAHPTNAPEVTVKREGDTWLATYEFPGPQKAWAFNRSALDRETNASWRVGKWQVVDRGVRLERVDGKDVLVATGASVPRTVRLRFTPHVGDLNADYEPSLRFSDGTLALFTGHFDVKALGSDTGALNHLTLKAPGQTILVDGAAHRDEVTLVSPGTYALIGDVEPIETPYLSAFVDPGLPDWAKDELLDFMPAALEYYTREMGPRGNRARPTIMVSWRGPTPQMSGLSGNALDGLIAMSIEGEGISYPDELMAHRMRWFIAHEAAHFWLGQTIQYDKEGDAWIMEGGADLAAIRAVSSLRPGFDAQGEEAREWRECEAALRQGTLDTARQRGDFQMPYSCGAVLMMGAESVNGGDYFGFLRTLFAAEQDDGLASSEDWLDAFRRVGASREAVRLARQIASEQVADPARTLADFAQATGVRRSPPLRS